MIFLAGPIQGAVDWQKEAHQVISKLNPNITVVSPRRQDFEEKHDFDVQVDWETYYLNQTGQSGVILFWLAKENNHVSGRSYAQTTRWELATWKERHKTQGAKVVVGIEDGFTGERYIRRMMSKENPDIPIYRTLRQTCRAALELLGK